MSGLADDELDELVARVRREYGSRFPPGARDEPPEERQLREERTRLLIDGEVLSGVAAQRRLAREPALTPGDESALLDRLIGGMFSIPNLLEPLRRRTVTDILVIGSNPPRIEEVDGSITLGRPVVRRPRDLERVIYDVAEEHGRPFNHENHIVDLEIEPGVRFHGSGFDPVQSPYITIRRAVMFGTTLDELYDRGMFDQGFMALMRAAVAARCSVLVVGPMGSGKTTLLRALTTVIHEDAVVATIESDSELNLAAIGRRWVIAYQERIAQTVDGRGFTPGQAMRPSMRSGADWLIVGEVRGGEGGPLVRAMQTGQGAMGTVHGGTAASGLANLVNLIAYDTGTDAREVKKAVYDGADLVVVVQGSNSAGRWVSEVVAPSVEADGDRFVLHRLFGPRAGADDVRARPLQPPQESMASRLRQADRSFDESWWTSRGDTYKPLQAGAV